MKRLFVALTLVACSHKPEPLALRVQQLEEVVGAQANHIYMLELDLKRHEVELDAHKALITAIANAESSIHDVKFEKYAKPSGWVDCWTDRQGYRNCTDANGNSSRRNF
jgi:hypothetical protein